MLKGYATSNGYMGYVAGRRYILFETWDAYYEYMEELECQKSLSEAEMPLSK